MQGEAIAGSSAIIFTSTDREIIKARGGEEVDRARSFREIFSNHGLTPKVENEQSIINPETDIKELENRQRRHQNILKNSVITVPRERVAITEDKLSNAPLSAEITPEPVQTSAPTSALEPPKEELHPETAAIAKELNLNPAEIFDKFSLEQNELYTLVYRIKELHLKRLLCSGHQEFIDLSEEIKSATLKAGKPEAKAWLEDQLDKLTNEAANYKLRLLNSLQAMEFDAAREESIVWLGQLVNPLH